MNTMKEHAIQKITERRGWIDVLSNKNRDRFKRPHMECRVCGRKYGAETDYHFFEICGECAEIIANLYSRAHAGDYLTWLETDRGGDGVQKNRATISKKVRWAVWARDNFTCCHCECREDLTLDHIIPWSKGGSDDEANLQTLCGSCNSKKGVKAEPKDDAVG